MLKHSDMLPQCCMINVYIGIFCMYGYLRDQGLLFWPVIIHARGSLTNSDICMWTLIVI